MRMQSQLKQNAWRDEIQKKPEKLPENTDKVRLVLVDSTGNAISTRAGWEIRRNEIRKKWMSYLGEIPQPNSPPVWKVLETDTKAGVLRELVEYEAEPGLPVQGYLLRPLPANAKPAAKSIPAAVVLHSTVDYTIRQPAGLEGPEDKWIGLHLARRGYAAFCPKCYLWEYGEPKNILKAVSWLHRRHPMVRGMAKMLFDAVRAVDLLAALPEVNPRRIGSVGHSLGAKEVLYLAAFDERIRATVSSEGGIGIGYSNWNAPWYLDSAIGQMQPGLNHADLLALVAPRAFLLMGGDSADGDISWPYIEANLPVWKLTGNTQAIGNWNHRLGHAFPPAAMQHTLEWFDEHMQG
ncbi:MAG: dienelactone hydrolase family protein [bacterium]